VLGREGRWTLVEAAPHVLKLPGVSGAEGTEIVVGVRPERVRLVAVADAGAVALAGDVERVAFVGNAVRYYVRCAGDLLVTAEDQDRKAAFAAGQRVAIEWDADALMTWSG
jgi:ABC-type Fe3+/spermidine/putrescine transport system ATPase subunit